METVQLRSVGDRYRVDVDARQHRLIVDEPTPVSSDLGPSPYELLLAALGSCTSMTLLMYARRNGMQLEAVEIQLAHDRQHVEDSERYEQGQSRVDVIRRRIHLDGPLTEEQRERLMGVARACPVHRTLASAVIIHDELI